MKREYFGEVERTLLLVSGIVRTWILGSLWVFNESKDNTLGIPYFDKYFKQIKTYFCLKEEKYHTKNEYIERKIFASKYLTSYTSVVFVDNTVATMGTAEESF